MAAAEWAHEKSNEAINGTKSGTINHHVWAGQTGITAGRLGGIARRAGAGSDQREGMDFHVHARGSAAFCEMMGGRWKLQASTSKLQRNFNNQT